MFMCEDTFTGQIFKYLDGQDNMDYNTYCFEMRQMLRGAIIHSMLEDVPQALLQIFIIKYSKNLTLCHDKQGSSQLDNT